LLVSRLHILTESSNGCQETTETENSKATV